MHNVVILGGGFGGVRTALDLDRHLGNRIQITLIDRNSYHLFVPSLYEVASAFGTPEDRFSVNLRKTVSIPFSDIFQGTNIHFVQAEVGHVSLDEKFVSTRSDAVHPFDYVVLALGAQAADYGIPGVREYAFPFKTIDDALMLNHELVRIYDRALRQQQQLPVKIVVGGGGFTGVELAAEIAKFVHKLGRKLPHGHTQISLIEAGAKILPNISDQERAAIIRRLTHLGIGVKTHCAVEHVAQDMVMLSSGATIKSDMVVWTAGIKPNEFLRTIQGLELTSSGKVIVDEHLNTPRYPFVFALGDIIEFIDPHTQRSEPALGYIAVQHGQVIARNIERSLKGKELRSHKPLYKLWIVPVGGKYALAHLWFGLRLKGFLGWLARCIADLRYFRSILGTKKALKLFREEMNVFVKND